MHVFRENLEKFERYIHAIIISSLEGIFEIRVKIEKSLLESLLSSKNTLSTLPDRTLKICRSKVKGAEQVDRLEVVFDRQRERKIRVSRSTRIIGSGWKQRNPLIETWPPRRFNHLSRIPIYVTVIKGGGAQTCGPSFVHSWVEYKAALKFLMRRGKRIECEIRLVEFLSIKFSWKLPTVGD